MSNRDLILRHLQFEYPREVSNSNLVKATRIQPHQQVFQITKQLLAQGVISGRKLGAEWFFRAKPTVENSTGASLAKDKPIIASLDPTSEAIHELDSTRFEQMARDVFSNFFATDLRPGSLPGISKKWDLLSRDGQIVGDAKFYTLVGGVSLPPAKFSVIAEHVWLLEKTTAKVKLLVFGHQIEVPRLWLSKYGNLVKDVVFYFLDNDGVFTKLN